MRKKNYFASSAEVEEELWRDIFLGLLLWVYFLEGADNVCDELVGDVVMCFRGSTWLFSWKVVAMVERSLLTVPVTIVLPDVRRTTYGHVRYTDGIHFVPRSAILSFSLEIII